MGSNLPGITILTFGDFPGKETFSFQHSAKFS
jgi:hypothetical protein